MHLCSQWHFVGFHLKSFHSLTSLKDPMTIGYIRCQKQRGPRKFGRTMVLVRLKYILEKYKIIEIISVYALAQKQQKNTLCTSDVRNGTEVK